MDQYFTQMGKIVNEKKTSSRVRFMLQDVIDLRKVSDISNFDEIVCVLSRKDSQITKVPLFIRIIARRTLRFLYLFTVDLPFF